MRVTVVGALAIAEVVVLALSAASALPIGRDILSRPAQTSAVIHAGYKDLVCSRICVQYWGRRGSLRAGIMVARSEIISVTIAASPW
jgi:hypothetical protein